jgi:hypothetical protein
LLYKFGKNEIKYACDDAKDNRRKNERFYVYISAGGERSTVAENKVKDLICRARYQPREKASKDGFGKVGLFIVIIH